ncbi:MAG: hypothetical protein SOI13_01365 [Bifidobacterium mongoliense]|jgi:hypothetical protein|uniref:hypothetical protein n=1 Tax=Bifidobacterium mongoliense TaxID=518643 RepID=UPI002F353213
MNANDCRKPLSITIRHNTGKPKALSIWLDVLGLEFCSLVVLTDLMARDYWLALIVTICTTYWGWRLGHDLKDFQWTVTEKTYEIPMKGGGDANTDD